MNLSQASLRDSESCCTKDVMSFLNFTVLAGGKYFARNFVAREFQVVMESAGSECSQALALSFKEYGKTRSLIASLATRL